MSKKKRTISTKEDTKEECFFLRLPEKYAQVVADAIKPQSQGNMNGRFKLNISKEEFTFDGKSLKGKLYDLPTIVEIHKTPDKKHLYKTGDVHQMFIVKDSDEDDSSEDEKMSNVGKKVNRVKFPHGVTPPLKNVRRKRFRKTAKRVIDEQFDTEHEVQRLLAEDDAAMETSVQIINLDTATKSDVAKMEDVDEDLKRRSASRASSMATPARQNNATPSEMAGSDAAPSEADTNFDDVKSQHDELREALGSASDSDDDDDDISAMDVDNPTAQSSISPFQGLSLQTDSSKSASKTQEDKKERMKSPLSMSVSNANPTTVVPTAIKATNLQQQATATLGSSAQSNLLSEQQVTTTQPSTSTSTVPAQAEKVEDEGKQTALMEAKKKVEDLEAKIKAQVNPRLRKRLEESLAKAKTELEALES